jgi:hypothetical protein
MHTRAQIAGLVTFALAVSAGCRALELDLAVADAAAGDPVTPILCATDAAACTGTATPICDEDAGVCVQCLSANDCHSKSNIPHCVNKVCIACTSDPDCNDGGPGPRVCNLAIPRCATRCDQDADSCLGLGPPQYACPAPVYPYCVECTQAGDQAPECRGRPGGSHCFGLPSGACGCLDDSDCDAGRCQPPSGPSDLQFCEPPALLQ